MEKKTYEEFRADWYAMCPNNPEFEYLNSTGLREYFCECDYRRYLSGNKQEL